jgi:hypothetical protein
MSDTFGPYQKAYDAYTKDLEQLTSIKQRLLDGIKADNAELRKLKTGLKRRQASKKDASMVADLQGKYDTFAAQWCRLDDSERAATNRFHAAIDAVDAKQVLQLQGICSYVVGSGNGDAGINYLYEEVRAYDKLKGDFSARKAKFSEICNVLSAVVDAAEKQHESTANADILRQFNALEGAEQTAFYKSNHAAIVRAQEARKYPNP